jgi:hypothetical protein
MVPVAGTTKRAKLESAPATTTTQPTSTR